MKISTLIKSPTEARMRFVAKLLFVTFCVITIWRIAVTVFGLPGLPN